MKKVEGNGFGCPVVGFSDSVFQLLQKLVNSGFDRDKSRINSDIARNAGEVEFAEAIQSYIASLSPKSDISPKGLIALLSFVHDVSSSETSGLSKRIFKDTTIKMLGILLRENQLQAINEWPKIYNGGQTAVNSIVSQVLRILTLPYTHVTFEKELDSIGREYISSEIIQVTLQSLRHVSRETIPYAIALLSRLILNTDNDKPFAKKFIDAKGITIIQKYNLLAEENSSALVIDVLSLISQLARISKDNYDMIHQLNIYRPLKTMIQHRDPGVRSKVCNLIGNICRHSGFFYDMLLREDLISAAIKCCNDPDRNTRKFACFAVGNAGFHNEKLYEHLRPCVPLLVDLLKDPEEKTRANAAGALGNFVRNSNALCRDLIMHGALNQLLEVVKTDQGPSQSPRRIALFSIGNLCVYPECKSVFETLNIRQTLDEFKQPYCRDSQVLKYAARIIKKLDPQ